MSINQTCLESEIQTAVDNLTTSCSAEVFLETALAADNASVNRKFSVALGCQLPDLNTASIPQGTIVYVEELGVPVVATNTSWKGLDGRLYRKDVTLCELYAWGCNISGKLGINCITNVSSPVQEITSSDNWTCVVNRFSTSIGIKTDGSVWAWGCNQFGRLGTNDIIDTSSPVQEITSSSWIEIGGGSTVTGAIKADGTLWGWGCSNCGTIGNNFGGAAACYSSPVQEITSSTNWCKVSNGLWHAAFIKSDGTLWGTGSNTNGPLGIGVNFGNYSSPTQEISSSTNWSAVASGIAFTAAVKSDGTLWSMGCNSEGVLADGTLTCRSSPVQETSSSTNWGSISSYSNHTHAIKTDGTLWGTGNGSCGRLGIGSSLFSYVSYIQEASTSTNWCNVSAGFQHSMGIKTDGTLWGWGRNICGAILQNSLSNFASPVRENTSAGNWGFVSAGTCSSSGIKVT